MSSTVKAQRRLTIASLMSALLVTAAAGGAFGAEADQDVLKVIIEKAREREAAFRGMDRVQTGSTVDTETGREFLSYRSRWVESGGRFLGEVEQLSRSRDGTRDDDQWNKWTIKRTSDGRVTKSMEREGEGQWAGSIGPPNAEYDTTASGASPGTATFINGAPGTLSEVLGANTDEYTGKYVSWTAVYSAEVTVRGEETIDGRDCVLVDISFESKDGSDKSLATLAFDKALNYACVRSQAQRRSSQGVRSEVWEMGDFREVKKGLWFPFSTSGESVHSNMRLHFEWKTEKLEFPDSFDDSLFTFEFPAGTPVYNSILREEYTVGGGLKAKLTDEGLVGEAEEHVEAEPEKMASSDEATLLQPAIEPTQEKPIEKGRTGGWPVVFFLAAAFVIVAAVAIWRRRRHT